MHRMSGLSYASSAGRGGQTSSSGVWTPDLRATRRQLIDKESLDQGAHNSRTHAQVSKASTPTAIMGLKPYEADRYSAIDLNRLTVFAIKVLSDLDVPATFENIAVALFRMFPRRFAMVGFAEYPDATRVNRALLQLRPKYRNWATGKTRLGWQLTVGGEEEARALMGKLGTNASVNLKLSPSDLQAEPGGKVKRTVHAEDGVARIRTSALWQKFQLGWENADALEALDVLEAYSHTPPEALTHRLARLRTTAASVGDDDVVNFLMNFANDSRRCSRKR